MGYMKHHLFGAGYPCLVLKELQPRVAKAGMQTAAPCGELALTLCGRLTCPSPRADHDAWMVHSRGLGVFDGAGGGGFASGQKSRLLAALCKDCVGQWGVDASAALGGALQIANAEARGRTGLHARCWRLGSTTAALGVLAGDALHVACMGDSQVALLRPGREGWSVQLSLPRWAAGPPGLPPHRRTPVQACLDGSMVRRGGRGTEWEDEAVLRQEGYLAHWSAAPGDWVVAFTDGWPRAVYPGIQDPELLHAGTLHTLRLLAMASLGGQDTRVAMEGLLAGVAAPLAASLESAPRRGLDDVTVLAGLVGRAEEVLPASWRPCPEPLWGLLDSFRGAGLPPPQCGVLDGQAARGRV